MTSSQLQGEDSGALPLSGTGLAGADGHPSPTSGLGPSGGIPSAGLTPAQWDMLGRVVNSNGGGLSAYSEDQRVWKALVRKGLIQGKAGQEWRMVHTREGLQAWRAWHG